MATQYKDGTFGETLPVEEAFKEFREALDADTAKAFHVGTPQEIENVKQNVDLEKRLDSLSEQLADIKADNSKIIDIPTLDEIKKYETSGG